MLYGWMAIRPSWTVTVDASMWILILRSECAYLEKDTYPTEEEQFRLYKTVVEAMEGKPVIIRTLDIGADKQPGYMGRPKEETPPLGGRAIGACL